MTMQTTWAKSKARSGKWRTRAESVVSLTRRPLIFNCLVVFFALYYYRPEDLIRALAYIPMAKISGGLAFVALLASMLGGGKFKVPAAVKILWLLLVQMTLCIPLAMWPGGAFHTVFDKFAKGVVVAMLISMVVVSLRELRKLLWIQASAVALVTLFSIALHSYGKDGRLSGIQESILSNPNDLAINIAISFPLALAFMLHARGFKKALWALGLAVMAVGVVLTQSRSGLLALIIIIVICVWEYGIKGKRRQVVVVTAVALVVGMCIALSSAHYRARVESIFKGDVEGISAGERGSLEARRELLKKSVMVALTHPVFGVGPGCFILVDQGWHVAHNAYTELAAESGIPALLLFLMAMGAAFKNITQLRKSNHYRDDPEFTLFTQALWAGLVGYLTGSCFASTEYNLYPYFVIGYTCAMVRIIRAPLPARVESEKGKEKVKGFAVGRLSFAGRPVSRNALTPTTKSVPWT
ncbi:MAG: O-antigen ligase family protein [Candidatus Sulfotelmatobacter sp.]|jgi:O-antigen ligase